MTQPEIAVGVLMGSESDLDGVRPCLDALVELEIPFDVRVLSAHRTPTLVADYARSATDRGMKVLICAAGHAAHLAGAVAAQTILPVIGIPVPSSDLHGVDSLYSTVQMPPGIPVATVAVGKGGARNAGILAAEILALSDRDLTDKLLEFRKNMERKALASDERVRRQFHQETSR